MQGKDKPKFERRTSLVLDEYLHLLKGQNLDLTGLMKQLREAINLNSSSIKVDSFDTFHNDESRKMRCHYAAIFENQDLNREAGQERATGLREVFNSPFPPPFVLTTTSLGQEGLDFHSYSRRIVPWNLPTNPIDLEQREGRINRYKSLVTHQHLARKYRTELAAERTNEVGRHLGTSLRPRRDPRAYRTRRLRAHPLLARR